MDRPVVSEIAEEIYDSLEPFARLDPETEYALLKYIEAWAGSYLGDLYDIVRDRDNYPGWTVLLDPDEAPVAGLPYLAQFVGVELSESMTVEQRREAIKVPSGFQRGTLPALIQATQKTLTGSRIVLVAERHEGSAYKLWVRTHAVDTPDVNRTHAAVLSQKPLGIVLTYEAIEGQTWLDVDAQHADWDEVEAEYATWNDVAFTFPAE